MSRKTKGGEGGVTAAPLKRVTHFKQSRQTTSARQNNATKQTRNSSREHCYMFSQEQREEKMPLDHSSLVKPGRAG